VIRPLVVLAAALTAGAAAHIVGGPNPQTQAAADGCRRDTAKILEHLAPNWAYVNDRGAAATGPAPQPQWASGTAVAGGRDPQLAIHPAGIDDPFTHGAYDGNLNVKPDPRSAYLLGVANFSGRDETDGRLHAERESGNAWPMFAWPEQGERVTLLGSWVWDCDHYQGEGEHTELHPIRALWLERTPSPRSATGQNEGDLYASSDGTAAGLQAECAHRTKGDEQAFHACLTPGKTWLDPSGDYRFTLPLPPRPSPAARLRVRVLDVGSVGAPPLHVVRRGSHLLVTAAVRATPGRRLVLAKRVLAGWSRPPRRRLVHLRVTTLSLLVRRALDPTSALSGQTSAAPGEWNVYQDAAGIWSLWAPSVLRTRDGREYDTRHVVDLYLPRGRPWRFFLFARECDFGSLGSALGPSVPVFPCPRTRELGGFSGGQPGDDLPGRLAVRFRSPESSIGLHRANSSLAGSTCPRSVRTGCFRLTFLVARVS
jgi:hypothetical protein